MTTVAADPLSPDNWLALRTAFEAAMVGDHVVYLPGGPGVVYVVDSWDPDPLYATYDYQFGAGPATGHVTVRVVLRPQSYLRFVGDGATIKRGPSLMASNVFLMGTPDPVHRFTIEGLNFDQNVHSIADNLAINARSPLLHIPAGSTRVKLDGVEFQNVGASLSVTFGSDDPFAAQQSHDITWRDVEISRSLPGPVQDTTVPHGNPSRNGPENASVAGIANASGVVLDDVRVRSTLTGPDACIGGVGIVATSPIACHSAGYMRSITVRNSKWWACQSTGLFIRGNPSTYMGVVNVSDCESERGGYMIEKGALVFGDLGLQPHAVMVDAHVRNFTVKNFGFQHSAHGDATTTTTGAISIGNDKVINWSIEGCIIDGADQSGSLPYLAEVAPNGRQTGIAVKGGAHNGLLAGNIITNLGGPGIYVDGGTGAPVAGGVYDLSLNANKVIGCCRQDTSTLGDAGIAVRDHVTGLVMNGNTSRDNGGASGTETAGIGFYGTPGDNQTQSILLDGNTCSGQKYGIRMGFTGGTTRQRPRAATIVHNDVRGNSVGGIFADTVLGPDTRSYEIRDNPGHQAATVPSAMVGPLGGNGLTAQDGIIVTGASLRDYVTISHTGPLQNGLVLSGVVSAPGVVDAAIHNPSTVSVTLPAGSLVIRTEHRNLG